MGGGAGILSAPAAALGKRRLAAGGALAALLLIGVVTGSPIAALFAKALADPLFHSTSAGGAVALLALVALGLATLASATAPGNRRTVRVATALLLGGSIVGNATNVGLHLWLLDDCGWPGTLAVTFWSGETNTYSDVLHSHAAKAALDALLAGWAEPLVHGFDLGAGLTLRVPAAGIGLVVVALVAAIVGYAALLPAVVHRWPGWPVALLFVFAACNTIKTIADGGMLTCRFASSLAVLLILLPRLCAAGARLRAMALGGAVACVGASAALVYTLAGSRVEALLRNDATTVAVIGALCAWAMAGRRWRRVRVCLGTGLAAVIVLDLGHAIIATPIRMLLPLPQGAVATVCTRVDACTTTPAAGRTAFEIYRSAGDDPLKPRRTLIATHAGAARSSLNLAIHPLRTRAVAVAAAEPVIEVRPLRALPGGSGVLVQARSEQLPAVFGDAPGPFASANFHVFLHQTAAALRAQGLDEFVMAPLRNAADARALGWALLP